MRRAHIVEEDLTHDDKFTPRSGTPSTLWRYSVAYNLLGALEEERNCELPDAACGKAKWIVRRAHDRGNWTFKKC